LGCNEKRERRERLRKPDRTAVARREHKPVHRPLFPLRHERPTEREQRGEKDRDPEEARRLEPRRLTWQRKVEDDEDGRDEEEHRRQRVPRPQLEQQILPRKRTNVADVAHASASRPLAYGATRAGSCVETRRVR